MAPCLEGEVSYRLARGCPCSRQRRQAHRRCKDRSWLGNRVSTFVHQTRRAQVSRCLLSKVSLGSGWSETKKEIDRNLSRRGRTVYRLVRIHRCGKLSRMSAYCYANGLVVRRPSSLISAQNR